MSIFVFSQRFYLYVIYHMDNKIFPIKKGDRLEIAILLKKNYSLRDIGAALGRSVSTISDELKRNSVKGEYAPDKAQHKAYVKRLNASYRGKSIVDNSGLRKFVEEKLLEGRSPESISGRLKNHRMDLPYVSKDTIYRYLEAPMEK